MRNTRWVQFLDWPVSLWHNQDSAGLEDYYFCQREKPVATPVSYSRSNQEERLGRMLKIYEFYPVQCEQIADAMEGTSRDGYTY